MPLDPSIILSGQQQPSVADQYGRAFQLRALVGQGELQNLQLQQARREQEQGQTLRDLYAGNVGADGKINQAGVIQGAAAQGLGDRIPALQKGFAEAERAGVDLTKARGDVDAQQFDMSRKKLEAINQGYASLLSNPNVTHDDVIRAVSNLRDNGIIDDKAAVQIVRELPGPEGLRSYLMQHAMESLDTAKQLELQTPKFQQIDAGGQVLTGTVDPMSGRFTQGGAIQKTETPDGRRARETALKPPAGYRWAADGKNLEAITGGPADKKEGTKNAVPTEDERKASGWLAQAQNSYKNMVAAIGEDPAAQNPGLIESAPDLPEAVKNWSRSDARQKYTQAASSFAEAALRAATGAGVTKDEANQKIRELTPQLGDSAAVIQQKQDSLAVYLQLLQSRAGRAAPDGPAVPVAGPKVGETVDGYLFKGGDPADPASWEATP